MSRTTNTTPPHVQLAQNPHIRRERHDHRLHDCSLPSVLDLAREDVYRYGACRYSPTQRYRNLMWKCTCERCEYHGATPPRILRRRGRVVTRRVAGRAPDYDVLDEISEEATPRR